MAGKHTSANGSNLNTGLSTKGGSRKQRGTGTGDVRKDAGRRRVVRPTQTQKE